MAVRRTHRPGIVRRSRALWAAALAVVASTCAAPASSAGEAKQLSLTAIPGNRTWYHLVDSPGPVARPARVLDVTGGVTDPQALLGGGTTVTTLDFRPGGPAPSVVLDFGADVGGYPTFSVTSTTGTVLASTCSETLANLGNDGALSVGFFHSGDPHRTDTFDVVSPGTLTSPEIQGGERYERLTLTKPGRVTLDAAGIILSQVREVPSDMPGHFLSSDNLLNRIWYAGAYTLSLDELAPGVAVQPGAVNQAHLILDGAKRDRAVWSGDQLIADMVAYYASDPSYARDSLALLLDHPATVAGELVPAQGNLSTPGPLPGVCTPNPNLAAVGCFTWSATYSMASVIALAKYYLYTGDLAFVRQHWVAVVRQMAWDAHQVDAHGLVSVSAADDADWNIEHIPGELTYVNAMYVLALRAAASLASALDLRSDAAAWTAQAAAITGAVNRQLWDPTIGAYDASTSQRGVVVQDANVMAVLAGIPDHTRARQLLGTIASRLNTPFGPATVARPTPSGFVRVVSPYMSGFEVQADFGTGLTSSALSLIRSEWGWMVSHDPGGTDWERIQMSGGLSGGPLADSAAHAWSTDPTAALSEYVLGVRPTQPGYSRWQIAPVVAGLQWAQGAVPTPHGPIDVRWRMAGQGSFVLTIDTPKGSEGTVDIPLLDANGTIACAGAVMWSRGHPTSGVAASRDGRGVVLHASSGPWTCASVR